LAAGFSIGGLGNGAVVVCLPQLTLTRKERHPEEPVAMGRFGREPPAGSF